MFSRRQLLGTVLVAAAPAAAQDDAAPRRVILDASRALQAGNAARFMGYFDKQQFQAFLQLQRTITALLETRTVASSVDVLSVTEKATERIAKVDWLLQLTPLSGPGPVETRREAVEITLAQAQGVWRVTTFEPIDLFRVI